VLILFSLLLVAGVSARPYESYTADFTIVESDVVVNMVLKFENSETGTFYLSIPEDARTIDLYIGQSAAEPLIEDGKLKIDLRSTKEVGLSYVTKYFLDKNNFLINFQASDTIKDLKLQVTLPEGALLKKPIVRGDVTSGSIFPKPDSALTDGRNMIFVWEKADVAKDDEVSIFVQYKLNGSYALKTVIFLLIFLAAAIGYLYYKKFGFMFVKPEKEPEKAPIAPKEKEPEKEPEILKHLKEDEQQIIRILKQKEGKCEQGTIRVVANFSKAHLSRLLMELEARKIIYKEKRGKKNLVFLKKA
jgi:uncharacterized membrane protein